MRYMYYRWHGGRDVGAAAAAVSGPAARRRRARGARPNVRRTPPTRTAHAPLRTNTPTPDNNSIIFNHDYNSIIFNHGNNFIIYFQSLNIDHTLVSFQYLYRQVLPCTK